MGEEKCTPRENPGYAYSSARPTSAYSTVAEWDAFRVITGVSKVSRQHSHFLSQYNSDWYERFLSVYRCAGCCMCAVAMFAGCRCLTRVSTSSCCLRTAVARHSNRSCWLRCRTLKASDSSSRRSIGVARGCSGCTCTPRAVKEIFFRPNLQEKCVRAPPGHEVHPQPEQESIFRIVFAGFGGIFFGKKVHPRQNSGYAYALFSSLALHRVRACVCVDCVMEGDGGGSREWLRRLTPLGVLKFSSLPPVTSLGRFYPVSVRLLATSRKNYWNDFQENFTRDIIICGQGKLIKCWKSSASGARMFLNDSSTLWDKLAYIAKNK